MSMTVSQSLRYWRWTFIILEAMLVTSFVIGVFVAPHLGWRGPFDPPTLAMAHGVFVILAWLFLLIASPFFLRSLRGVAFTGLIIALGVLVYFIGTFAFDAG